MANQPRICPRCGGSGQVSRRVKRNGQRTQITERCNRCKGRGRLKKAVWGL
jgi:DnaJ-class molecular chaperone